MPTSKVYFTDLRTQIGVSQLDKLEKLIRAAGIGDIDFDHKMTAIKIHFGEPGNLTYLRPNYAKRVADVIKSLGGLPFLTDCNTLYPGRRKNALEHIESAYENGFTPYSTGCQVIIADGLKGSDDIEVPVQGGEYVKTAKIGRAIMDADIFISLSHFKGHEMTGFGGTIKNIGMGCGSRRGKMEQHAAGKPNVSAKRCVGLPPVRQTVRPGRHLLWRGPEGLHRPQQVRGLRPVHRLLQLRCHFGKERLGNPGSEPEDGRVRQGGGGRAASVPHQPGH